MWGEDEFHGNSKIGSITNSSRIIRVIEVVDSTILLLPEQGKLLAKKIKLLFNRDRDIIIDFEGYEYFSSTFMNHSIGQLLIDLDLDKKKFNKYFRVTGLKEDDTDDVSLVLNNSQMRRKLYKKGLPAEEYYSNRLYP
jgi:hypothetical protein